MASTWKKFPIAEKNLLKIFISNKNILLQIVNNRTGQTFLQANTQEKVMRETLNKTYDKEAAQATAGLLARRCRIAGQQQITYERGKQRYAGKVKVVIDTLREHGMEFVQHAAKRAVMFPWDKKPPQQLEPGARGLATPREPRSP